jgi:hypothetical protein
VAAQALHACALTVALLCGLADTRAAESVAPSGRLLPEFDPSLIRDPAQANLALDETSRVHAALQTQWRFREWGCYQKFMVNGCLADLNAERRAAELRLRLIDIRARQVLREDDAVRRAADEAASLADRVDELPDAAQRREQERDRGRDRAEDNRERNERKQLDDEARREQGRQAAARMAERELDTAKRLERVEERRIAAPANAEQRRERERAQRERQREHDRRVDAQRAKAGGDPTPQAAGARPPEDVSAPVRPGLRSSEPK